MQFATIICAILKGEENSDRIYWMMSRPGGSVEMVIKSGNSDDYLENPTGEHAFFLSSAAIDKSPSTKPRNEKKRSFVLWMEIEEIRKKFKEEDFPLANYSWKGGPEN